MIKCVYWNTSTATQLYRCVHLYPSWVYPEQMSPVLQDCENAGEIKSSRCCRSIFACVPWKKYSKTLRTKDHNFQLCVQEDTMNNPGHCQISWTVLLNNWERQQSAVLHFFTTFCFVVAHLAWILLYHNVKDDMGCTRIAKVTYSNWHGWGNKWV